MELKQWCSWLYNDILFILFLASAGCRCRPELESKHGFEHENHINHIRMKDRWASVSLTLTTYVFNMIFVRELMLVLQPWFGLRRIVHIGSVGVLLQTLFRVTLH